MFPLLLLISLPPCAEALSTMASVRRNVSRAQSLLATVGSRQPVDPWDNLAQALQDDPPGTFRQLVDPLLYINQLTYSTSHPTASYTQLPQAFNIQGHWRKNWSAHYGCDNETTGQLSGGGNWSRYYEADQDHPTGGPTVRVLIDYGAKKVIVGIRGVCLDFTQLACHVSCCACSEGQTGFSHCDAGVSFKAFLQQVADTITFVKSQYSTFSLLISGHSFGGQLGLSLVALGIQDPVVVFSPVPYKNALRGLYGWSEEQLQSLNASSRFEIIDEVDSFSLRSDTPENSYPGTTYCVFDNQPLTNECQKCVDSMTLLGKTSQLTYGEILKLCADNLPSFSNTTREPEHAMNFCKQDSHTLDRYVDVFLPSGRLPSCRVLLA